MRYEGMVFRPPSEADSFILQATIGCSHNGCTFCGMYKDKKFRVRTLEEIQTDIRLAKLYYGDVKKVFLADGDALAMPTEELIQVLSILYKTFPGLRHVGIYAGPRSILNKGVADLTRLKENGLTIAYLGVETGDPELLAEVNKGVNDKEMVAAGRAVVQSGLKLSVTVILGLAGRDRERSKRHAEETARIINLINPHYLAALVLMLEPNTVLYRKMQSGKFALPEAHEILEELRVMVANLEVENCIFRSNHASNYLALRGTLSQDKAGLLRLIDSILKNGDWQLLRPDYLRGL
ncbi:radical SAM protein [Moorella sulfitireducens (nom. illeg.)]|uniref:radical SAM protein n=1 Tax=Neomoorella sulfitireducens TaxID=2972948 RepID=UPI0021AD4A20|nr:radical SAM protein [Moorella sulfitireducens]